MNKQTIVLVVALMALALVLTGAAALAQGGDSVDAPAAPDTVLGSSFTYQGNLTHNSASANGQFDFRFRLYDKDSGGSQLGTTLYRSNVPVTGGQFVTTLDFGRHPLGRLTWLEVSVRPHSLQAQGADDTYVKLSPRQPIRPAPVALGLPGPFYSIEQNASPNYHGGYGNNGFADGVVGAVISGGGKYAMANRVNASYSVVSGGAGNQAGHDANDTYATVGGGKGNLATGQYATVGGGEKNVASGAGATVCGGGISGESTTGNVATGDFSTVCGGGLNSATASDATVAGGYDNHATFRYTAVGGGEKNYATGYGNVVAGGSKNQAQGSWNATIGGGANNLASGAESTIPGGSANVAQGERSFAAGHQAKALHDGSFVWGDANDKDIKSVRKNQWLARASGGVTFYTNSIHTSGVYVAPHGSSWNNLSDRNAKENFTPVDSRTLLERLDAIEISTWNYKAQDADIRHIGPMAQDFNALLPDLGGEGETYINAMDADGVSLAAIQALYRQNQEQAQQIETLQAENAELHQQLAEIAVRLSALEAAGGKR